MEKRLRSKANTRALVFVCVYACMRVSIEAVAAPATVLFDNKPSYSDFSVDMYV